MRMSSIHVRRADASRLQMLMDMIRLCDSLHDCEARTEIALELRNEWAAQAPNLLGKPQVQPPEKYYEWYTELELIQVIGLNLRNQGRTLPNTMRVHPTKEK